MTELYFVRHAQSEKNVMRHLVGGRCNSTPLTQKGRKQATALGKRWSNTQSFDYIYSSIADRCQSTALIVTNCLGFPRDQIQYSEEIVELSQGEWEGKLRKEIYTSEVLKAINKDNWNFKAPGGESQAEAAERMMTFVQNLVRESERKDKVAIFTHAGAIKYFLCKLMEFNPQLLFGMEIANTAITRLRYAEEKWNILTINDHAHLSTELE